MGKRESVGALRFDRSATRILRQVAAAAGERQATLRDLEITLCQPRSEELPQVMLHVSGELAVVLERAGQIAQELGTAEICRDFLCEAVAEAHARAAGLDLVALRRTRESLREAYGLPLSQRSY